MSPNISSRDILQCVAFWGLNWINWKSSTELIIWYADQVTKWIIINSLHQYLLEKSNCVCVSCIYFNHTKLIWQPFILSSLPYCILSCSYTVYINKQTNKLTNKQTNKYIYFFKGVIGCKIHFTSCLNINVCCVCTHPSHNDKNPPSVFFFKSLF